MSARASLWAVGVVRNEADILRVTVRHHLRQGVTRFLFLDNDSTDGTQGVLDRLRLVAPLEWRPYAGPFRQNELMTALAQEAFVRGADWVLPLDADEFWLAPGTSIREVLERTSAGALRVQLVNFVQHRRQFATSPTGLLTMTRRVDTPVGEMQEIASLVESNAIAYVEHNYVPKWIARACPTLEIQWGSHFLSGAMEPLVDTDQIVCLHAPLRSRAILEQKVDAARPAGDLADYLEQAWHVRRWRQLAANGGLDAEWNANSYLDEALDLHGQPRPLIVDTRLRELVAPWLATPEPAWPALGVDGTDSTSNDRRDEKRLRELLTAQTARMESLRADARRAQSQGGALQQSLDAAIRSLDAASEQLRLARDNRARAEERLHASDRMGEQLRERLQAAEASAGQNAAQADAERRRLTARIAELATELQRTQDEVKALRASWSWRVAAPLRWGFDTVHAITRGEKQQGNRQSTEPPVLQPQEAPATPLTAVSNEPRIESVMDLIAATRPGPSLPRILVISDAVPTPDLDAGSFRLNQMLLQLAAIGYRITFCANSDSTGARYDDALKSVGVEVIKGRDNTLRHLAGEGRRYQHVMLSRPEIAFDYLFAVRAHAVHARVVFDTVDLHWLRLQGQARVTNAPEMEHVAEDYARMELFNARGSDVTITVSDEERRTLLDRDGSLQVEVVPVIHPVVPRTNAWGDRCGLMFVGSYWHKPNEDAVLYFVRDILPRLREELPDVVFKVFGSRLPDTIKALGSPSVRCIGYVEDLTPYLEQARVFVAPLRFGAGVKGKIIHSMSHGLPVVTTSVGAEGLMTTSGEQLMVADTPDAFARAVVSLYTDGQLWDAISRSGTAHVSEHFSDTAARCRLQRIFATGAPHAD